MIDEDEDRIDEASADEEAASTPDEGRDEAGADDTPEEVLDAVALAAELNDARSELDEARAELARTRTELSEMTARLRAVSRKFQEQKEEMSAFRSRMEERAEVEKARRKAEVVRTFFDPVQNLARSLEAGGDGQGLREGVAMVHKQFMAGLEALGLAPTPGQGERFDPNLHEAIGVVPVPEASLDGRVIEVHVDGWMVDGRAIQAAKVTVGKHVAPEPTPEA